MKAARPPLYTNKLSVFLRTLDTSLFTKGNLKGGLAALFASLLAVCSTTAVGRESPLEANGVRSDFVCTHDVSPFPQNADAQRLFDYARHLDYLLEGRHFDWEHSIRSKCHSPSSRAARGSSDRSHRLQH